MWLYLRDSFLSIVEDRDNDKMLIVRARKDGDIQRVFPGTQIQETPTADYMYRARIPRNKVAKAAAEEVWRIDYDNFKGSVADKDRHDTYLQVWCDTQSLTTGGHWIDYERLWLEEDVEMIKHYQPEAATC